MTRLTRVLLLWIIALGSEAAGAAGREVVLNYADPEGVQLPLSVLEQARHVPAWLRDGVNPSPGAAAAQLALPRGDMAGVKRYVLSSKNLEINGSSDHVMLGSRPSEAVKIEPSRDPVAAWPLCGAQPTSSAPCRLSELTRQVVGLATKADAGTDPLPPLLASHRLVMDDRAAKRVVVAVGGDGAIQHVDFVGVVRGRTESLPAPDAASVFVIRLGAAGTYSVVERRADSEVDPSSLKFLGEN